MTKKKGKKRTTRGGDFLGDVDSFFRNSHIISNVGNVALPALGGFLGSFGGPLGTALGAAVGSSGNELIKHAGYGKRRKGGAILSTPLKLKPSGRTYPLAAVPYSMSH